jgi:hypothetical protein
MGKLITWIVLGLMVVVVPFGSWYYLNSGLQYRKDVEATLKAKDSLDLSLDTLGLLNKRCTVVVLNRSGIADTILLGIQKQYEKVNEFQMLSLDSIGLIKHLPKGYASAFFDKYKTNSFLILDHKLKLRNTYGHTTEDIKKLVEHTAIALPRAKEADIKMLNE